jgi:hypothetical protein
VSNTTSYSHECEYLDFSGGPFAVAIRQSATQGKLCLQLLRDKTILVHMDLNRSAALEIAGLIIDEVRYSDHLANRRG